MPKYLAHTLTITGNQMLWMGKKGISQFENRNKKVLRERKRHTARRVAVLSPDPVLIWGEGRGSHRVLTGPPPHPVPMGRGYPLLSGYPLLGKNGGASCLGRWGYPLAADRGTPPIGRWGYPPPPPKVEHTHL